MTIAVKASLRFIGTCRDLGCTYSVYIQTRQVVLGLCNEVWLHRFRSPPFGSPFHPFPFSHFFSFMSSLASCPVISSLSFFWAHTAWPLVCTRATYFQIRFRCHRLFLRTWFLFIATTHTLVPSCPLHVFILLSYCARTHTFALTLVLLASPRGGVCVCVPLVVTGILFALFLAGGLEPICLSSPTKLWHFGG